MLAHRIIIQVLSKSGVARVERSRNQCNATTTRITTAATESIIGDGLLMRKGERLAYFAYSDLPSDLGSYRFCMWCGGGVGDASIRLRTPFLSHQRPTSRAFEVSKVQSEAGPNAVIVSLPNLNAVSQCRRLPLCLSKSLGQPQRPCVCLCGAQLTLGGP
jgi:hypothetical protein